MPNYRVKTLAAVNRDRRIRTYYVTAPSAPRAAEAWMAGDGMIVDGETLRSSSREWHTERVLSVQRLPSHDGWPIWYPSRSLERTVALERKQR